MELKLQHTKRKFNLTKENWNYVCNILNHDMRFNTHHLLITEEEIESDDAHEIGCEIERCVKELPIYEYTSNNDIAISVVNPSSEVFHNGHALTPISNQSRKFLFQFSNFLKQKERIKIS